MKPAKNILSKLKYPEYWDTKTPSLESFLRYRREICPDKQLKRDAEHSDYILDLEKICKFYTFKSCTKALDNFKSEAKSDVVETFWNEQIELQRIKTLELRGASNMLELGNDHLAKSAVAAQELQLKVLSHRAEASTSTKKNEKDQENNELERESSSIGRKRKSVKSAVSDKRAKRKSVQSLNDSSNHFANNSINENDESECEEIIFELEELKKRLESYSLNEWIVGTINVSKKFKKYQMQVIENITKGEKITWDNKYEVLALSSIIVLVKPCPYFTFTTYEWEQVINTNPHAIKESILTEPLSSSLYEACSHIAMGLDYNFVPKDESDLGRKSSRIFNNLKEELPLAPEAKITEDEHRFNYLDPLLKPFFCGSLKNYEVRLNKSANGSLKRPDFSCMIDKITMLNSEVKPLGYTLVQKNKDFVKVHLRAKKSINQLLNKKGGPNQSMFFLNMGDNLASYFMDLQYDGIYQSWPWISTKLVTEKASFPLIVLTIHHLTKMEQQVQRIANDYERRSGSFTPPNQIKYIIEEPNSSQLKALLKK